MTSVLELRSVWGTGGGPEKTILFGAARHDRSRFAITVCYIRDLRDTVFGIDQRAGQLDVDYVEVRERHSFDTKIWSDLSALVRTRGIDIVHGHDYKTNLLAWLLARQTGALALGTAHGWTGQAERWFYYPAERQVLRRMPRVVAVSSDIKDALVGAGADPGRVTVLLNGIDPDAFRRDTQARDRARTELGLQPTDQAIGTIGRLEKQKRVDLLLDAFRALHANHPHARLVIAGDGRLRAGLEQQARTLGISGACRFLGHRLDVAHLHHAFDVFVQASEYEGTPNAVLEAMAMETPLVATDIGGTRELAFPDVHGLIVPKHNVGALEGALTTVLEHPAAARRRAHDARQRIEQHLSFAARTSRLEEIYDELMAARTSAAAARQPVGVRGA